MNLYTCTIYNDNYSAEDYEAPIGPFFVPAVRVARISVLARNGREAAARGNVRTVGLVRARFLRNLNAPTACILLETRWRSLARGLGRTTNWLGDCYYCDNRVEAFYIRAVRQSATTPAKGRHRSGRRRRLLLAVPSAN